MSAFVKSVEYVEITLSTVGPTSANLTKSQTIADCIPFFTTNLDISVLDNTARRHVEVYFEAGPKVTAEKGSGTGTVIIGIFVVEFDTTGDISVQQGTFDLLATETGTTETITEVTTTKAFCVIAFQTSANFDDFRRTHTAVKFNSGTVLSFDRDTASGTITGRYFVVATAGTDFSVIHQAMSVTATEETHTDTISSVTTNKTFVYNSDITAEEDDDIRDGGFVVDLQDSTTIRARRAFDSFGGSPGVANATATIEAQIVTAGGTEFSVERAECDFADSLTKANTVTGIDQTKAIVIGGGYQGIMSANSTDGADVSGNHSVLDFTSDTEVTGTRGDNTTVDGTTFFEVVEFVLAAAEAVPVINLVMAPYIPT